MRKIAIIKSRDFYENGTAYDDYSMVAVINSITEWSEVTEEEFKLLQLALPRVGCSMLERPIDEKAFIAKTVADYIAMARVEEERQAAEKKKREDAARERAMKRQLKIVKDKKALLEKLKAELGEG